MNLLRTVIAKDPERRERWVKYLHLSIGCEAAIITHEAVKPGTLL